MCVLVVSLRGVHLRHVQAQLGRAHKAFLAVLARIRFLLCRGAFLRATRRLVVDVVVVLRGSGVHGLLVEGGHVLGQRLDRYKLQADVALSFRCILQKQIDKDGFRKTTRYI